MLIKMCCMNKHSWVYVNPWVYKNPWVYMTVSNVKPG